MADQTLSPTPSPPDAPPPARERIAGRPAPLTQRLHERLRRVVSATVKALGRFSLEARLATGATLAFLGLTVWWLSKDTRVADWDSAQHTLYSFAVHAELAHGSLTAPFTEFNTYPPLAHIVGALGVFVGGQRIAAVILALNLVFVPLLALACFQVGRMLAGARAGLLAVVFALGTPMILSEAHEAYVDPMQAAFVAASVWAILASQRFQRVGIAALAGIATGLAMLTKETSPFFIAGLLAVVLARGGWRQWRGLLAYTLPFAAVALPWYLEHRQQLHHLVIAHTSQANVAEANPMGGLYPTLWSLKNFSWYLWSAANIELLAPLLALLGCGVLAGLHTAIRRRADDGDRSAEEPSMASSTASAVDDRGRRTAGLYPELLGGLFVAWAGMTWLTHKDPRYDLSALVYFAVLGTAWIVRLRPRLRTAVTAVLLAAVAANVAGVVFGVGPKNYVMRVALPGAYAKSPLERHLTFYSTFGWLRGAPESDDGNVLALMKGLHRDGVQAITFCCVNPIDFNVIGLAVMTVEAKVANPANLAALRPQDVFLAAHAPAPGDPPPCQRLSDGTGIYAELGPPVGKPFSQYRLLCPGRHPEVYGYEANAPLPPGLHLAS